MKYLIFNTYKDSLHPGFAIYCKNAMDYETDAIEILKSYKDKYAWEKFNLDHYDPLDGNDILENDNNMYISSIGSIVEVLNNAKDYNGVIIPNLFIIKEVGCLISKN